MTWAERAPFSWTMATLHFSARLISTGLARFSGLAGFGLIIKYLINYFRTTHGLISEAEVARFGVPIVTVVLIFDSLAVRERRFWNLAFENNIYLSYFG